jgi:hypothetical protein
MATCQSNAALMGGTLCAQQHCDQSTIKNYTHAVCNCQAPFLNGCIQPKPNCCSYDGTSPILVASPTGDSCYCCCSCLANGTAIAVNAGQTKAVELFLPGDGVYVADGASLSHWSQRTVLFSSGTGDFGAANTLIRIVFGPDEQHQKYIIANRNQPFLLAERKLKRAAYLVPGQDELLRADGLSVPIRGLEVGTFKKGVHHIATSLEPATSMDGHLILANGVVCGDYALQIANLDANSPHLMVEGHAKLPEFGTRRYFETYRQLVATNALNTAVGTKLKPADPEVFIPFGVKGSVPIPKSAQYFLTKEQAQDLKDLAPNSPLGSGVGNDLVNYLFKLFNGFYPDVTFYLDQENDTPNAYSFIEYNKPHVVVTGGLVVLDAIKFESLALIIAHELGHLYGGPPKGPNGYTCTGMADFAATAAIIPYVWSGRFAVEVLRPALYQITALFSYIRDEHRDGRAGDTCVYISIDCRKKALEGGAFTKVLPQCAGGAPDPTLQVVGATATRDGQGKTWVTVKFNQAVEKASAEAIANYSFAPLVQATSAMIDGSQFGSVRIQVDLRAGVRYTVQALSVLSADGHPLVSGKDSAEFQLD